MRLNLTEFRPQSSHAKQGFNEDLYKAILKKKGLDQEQIDLALKVRNELNGKYKNLI